MSDDAVILPPDQEPGFWAEWVPPRSAIAAAIQYPIDENWVGRIINAYRKDERARLRSLTAAQDPRP